MVAQRDFTTKLCGKGADCVHPNGPRLPLSEFYPMRGRVDGVHTYCKACCRAASRARVQTQDPGNEGEALVIEALSQVGIFALPGKFSPWTHGDITAWGCVRIEVKSATLHHRTQGKPSFLFNNSNRAGELSASDLVVLVCHWPDGDTFHVFPADHPAFYRPSGEEKTGFAYRPGSELKRSRAKDGVPLTDALMVEHENRWDLVELARLTWADRFEG